MRRGGGSSLGLRPREGARAPMRPRPRSGVAAARARKATEVGDPWRRHASDRPSPDVFSPVHREKGNPGAGLAYRGPSGVAITLETQSARVRDLCPHGLFGSLPYALVVMWDGVLRHPARGTGRGLGAGPGTDPPFTVGNGPSSPLALRPGPVSVTLGRDPPSLRSARTRLGSSVTASAVTGHSEATLLSLSFHFSFKVPLLSSRNLVPASGRLAPRDTLT